MAIAVNSQTQTPPKWSLHSRGFRPGAWGCLSGYLEFSVRMSPSDFCSHAHERTRGDTMGSYAYTVLLQRTGTHQRARARPRLAAPLPGLHLHPRGQRVHARPARPAPLRPPSHARCLFGGACGVPGAAGAQRAVSRRRRRSPRRGGRRGRRAPQPGTLEASSPPAGQGPVPRGCVGPSGGGRGGPLLTAPLPGRASLDGDSLLSNDCEPSPTGGERAGVPGRPWGLGKAQVENYYQDLWKQPQPWVCGRNLDSVA